jgi:hypothetical protein
MDGLRAGNLALAFALEIAMAIAFAQAGWALGSALWLRVVLAAGLPALAIAIWAVWAAPKSGRRLRMPALALLKAVLLGAGAAAFVAAGQGFIAAVYATLVVVNFLGMWAFGQW